MLKYNEGYYYSSITMLCLWRLFVSLLARRPGFDPTSVHVRFVVDKVTLAQYFYEYFRFPLSVTFYQFSVLLFIHMMLLPDGQSGEDWKATNKQCYCWNRRKFDRKVILLGDMFGYVFFLFYSDILFTVRPLLLWITQRKTLCALVISTGGCGGFVLWGGTDVITFAV
jgi:hypothetical protein